MIHSLLRPLLFRLDAERAHGLAVGAAAMLSRHRGLSHWMRTHIARPRALPIQIAGLTFANPIGLAAGMDKNAQAAMAWWAFGFGFVELGTITPRPQEGKPRPRMFRLPRMLALVNRMGFNNQGAAAVAVALGDQARVQLRPAFPLGISIGKNATTDSEHAVDDYAQAAAALAPHADYLAINISSPNTAGLRDLQTGNEVTRLIQAVRAAGQSKPIFVKIAPELSGSLLTDVLDASANAGAAGVIATNTLATMGRDGLPEGGLSGRPLREIALRQVAAVRQHLGNKLAIIGCGGVDDAPSARAMFDAGADLIQLYTALVYRGPFTPAKITRGLSR